MAKVFYELSEAAQRLGKEVGEVRQMAERNEIDEYRQGDQILYKAEQIDLLSGDPGGGDEGGALQLSDTGGNAALDADDDDDFGLSDSAGLTLSDSSEEEAAETIVQDDHGETQQHGGGISVLDDATGSADASADTLVSDEPSLDNVSLESFGSGSGLMDLTRESDDTSLGADGLLDELYSGGPEGPSESESETATGADADLFEGSATAEEAEPQPGAVAVAAVEPYDGRGSGLAGGMALGMTLALLGALAVIIAAMVGPVPALLGSVTIGGMGLVVPVGALLVLTILFGLIGFALGGRG